MLLGVAEKANLKVVAEKDKSGEACWIRYLRSFKIKSDLKQKQTNKKAP